MLLKSLDICLLFFLKKKKTILLKNLITNNNLKSSCTLRNYFIKKFITKILQINKTIIHIPQNNEAQSLYNSMHLRAVGTEAVKLHIKSYTFSSDYILSTTPTPMTEIDLEKTLSLSCRSCLHHTQFLLSLELLKVIAPLHLWHTQQNWRLFI